MSMVTLRDGDSSASIAVQFGFNCFEFRAQVGNTQVEVLDSDPAFSRNGERPSGNGIPLLFPFPNRIRDGLFHWEEKLYEIPRTAGRPHPIHGFALDTPWRVIEQDPRRVVGEWRLSRDAPTHRHHWPADCQIQVQYELQGPALRSKIRILNPDTQPLPWGFGTHAYFKLPLSSSSDLKHCLIEAPASEQWVLSDLIPTGERIPVPAEKDIRRGAYVQSARFDDVYTGLKPEEGALTCVVMDERAGLEIAQVCDPRFRELVVYTPPNRAAVCMEPYTCVTDAMNLQQRGIDAGWQVLQPGEEYTTWIDIIARPVLA
jgi:aldose 1-epimerase